MDYDIIEGISRADVAFRVVGRDPIELFFAGARAILSIMMQNPEIIRPEIEAGFECEAQELDLLYYDFLSEFIYFKDSKRLLLAPDAITIDSTPDGFHLACLARGETIDRHRHIFKVDIKAITMHHLIVVNERGVWTATAVVDV